MKAKKLATIILTLALALTLMLTLSACGGGDIPAANDTPQVQATEAPAPTEATTPSPTPDLTPEATPDDGGGTDDTSVISGESFFPGIDDTLIPSDTVKYIVGTLAQASYNEESESEGHSILFLKFTDVTENEFDEISIRYANDAIDVVGTEYTYDWGTISSSEFRSHGELWVSIYIRNE